jgi:hypothetical protein
MGFAGSKKKKIRPLPTGSFESPPLHVAFRNARTFKKKVRLDGSAND